MGFRFDRSGVRIPTLAVSAYIDPRTVVTDEYRNTSLIRTLRERFSLGPPLTGRDAVAADIAPILTRDTPRPQEDWPEVTARPVPPLLDPMAPMDKPLPPLGQYLLGIAIALDTMNTGDVPAIDPKTATVQQPMTMCSTGKRGSGRDWSIARGRRARGVGPVIARG